MIVRNQQNLFCGDAASNEEVNSVLVTIGYQKAIVYVQNQERRSCIPFFSVQSRSLKRQRTQCTVRYVHISSYPPYPSTSTTTLPIVDSVHSVINPIPILRSIRQPFSGTTMSSPSRVTSSVTPEIISVVLTSI